MAALVFRIKLCGIYLGACQNYGPFLGTLNIRCRTKLGTQKGTIILTTTHLSAKIACRVFGLGFKVNPGAPQSPKQVVFIDLRPQSRYYLYTWSPRVNKGSSHAENPNPEAPTFVFLARVSDLSV